MCNDFSFGHRTFICWLRSAAQRASGSDTIPKKNVNQCRALCESADLELQSIVIVANQTGCVCQVKQSATSGAAGAAGGGAVTVLLEQQRRAAQAQQQR